MKQTALITLRLAMLLAATLLSFRAMNAPDRLSRFKLIEADDKAIQYMGRIDFTNPKLPRFWASGVVVKAKFKGPDCEVVVNDEQLYHTSHNYLEVAVDDKTPTRIKLTEATNTIRVAEGLSPGVHTVTLCKDTESGIGYLEFVGFRCAGLAPSPLRPARKLEFIGDSITCGAGSDLAETPCGKGQWYDQHNAYLSYGPTAARRLHAQWHLSSVSGIGLIHSCCNMTITMPEVFDKLNQRENTLLWDFKRYQPDAVTVCLGQNDGIQNPIAFDAAYVHFIEQIRAAYPRAQILCLTSPMADASLTAFLKENLTRIVERVNKNGDKRVHAFFFSRSYNSGCGGHPDLAEHQHIADELAAYLKTTLRW